MNSSSTSKFNSIKSLRLLLEETENISPPNSYFK